MRLKSFLHLTLALGLIAAGAAAPETLDAMRWRRRILLVAAPNPDDPRAALQRRIFEAWAREAADRDLSLVEVTESSVAGASDPAASLRRRYHLDLSAFQVLLIGKDGHVDLRAARPIDAETLQGRIDAMPMRRAGER
jgi:hypothetical protein